MSGAARAFRQRSCTAWVWMCSGDLSPGMLAVARQEHPGIRFTVGSMLALDLPDCCLGGLLAYYSTIHVPDDLLSTVLAEFARVLGPGGHLLLAFQVGDEPLRLSEAFGHGIALEFHRRQPEYMAGLVEDAGLVMLTRLVREAEEDERTAQAYLVARKPTAATGRSARGAVRFGAVARRRDPQLRYVIGTDCP